MGVASGMIVVCKNFPINSQRLQKDEHGGVFTAFWGTSNGWKLLQMVGTKVKKTTTANLNQSNQVRKKNKIQETSSTYSRQIELLIELNTPRRHTQTISVVF